MENKYVLAMYDVRGKQDYIFRGNKLREIVGGSFVIRDIFKDELFPAAKIYRDGNDKGTEAIFTYKNNTTNNKFTKENFEKRISDQGYIGEVVYDGGGNFFVLYKDKETYIGVNKIFTKRVLEETYSLTVLCSCIEGIDFDNYTTLYPEGYKEDLKQVKGDQEKLYAENRKREARINPQLPAQVLPFTQVDYMNSLPLYKYNYHAKAKLSRESEKKYDKFYKEAENKKGGFDEKILDNIVTEKGKDSWIAVMYIDGNNMGAKVQNVFKKGKTIVEPTKVSYEEAIQALRELSDSIQKNYVEDRIAAIDEALKNKYDDKNEAYKRRLVVYAGDEINIILNAHDAYDAVKAYFAGVKNFGSACAGIALFKSHTPYFDAYQIAEQCCETGKALMKEKGMREVNFVDFHCCQGAIGTDIKSIRERETGDIISKPWMIGYDESQIGTMEKEKVVTLDMVDQMVKNLNTCSRTNIKGLLECAKNSEADLFTELTRMQLRRKNAQDLEPITKIFGCSNKQLTNEQIRNLVYDIVSVYDFWFGK